MDSVTFSGRTCSFGPG